MKTTTRLSLSLLVAALCACSARAGDVGSYLVIKGQHFAQTNNGVPVLDTFTGRHDNRPYSFHAEVEGTGSNTVTGAVFRKPNGVAVLLESDDFEAKYYEAGSNFLTKPALDAAYPSGNYVYTIATNGGAVEATLTLLPDRYPANAPRVLNWTALQSIIVTDSTTIQWEALPGGTTNDFIQLNIEQDDGTNSMEIFASGGPGGPDSLNGTSTSIVLPPNTLVAGVTYNATLVFARIGTTNVTAIPDATGLSAHYKETVFQIVGATPPPPAGRIRFTDETYSAREDAGEVIITLSRAGNSSGVVSVLVSTITNSASPGIDYQHVSERVGWDAGDDLNKDNIRILIPNDSLLEGNETFFVTISDPQGGADLGLPVRATVTIIDDEIRGAGTLQFGAAMFMGVERTTNVAVTVTRTGGATGRVEVIYYATTQEGGAQSPADFTVTGSTLVFSNGVTTRTINIPVVADNLDETNETFVISLANPTGGAALGARSSANVVIKDDDTAGTLAFSAALYSVPEFTTNATNRAAVIVRRTGGGADAVGVDLAVLPGTTAELDEDYTHAGGDSVTLHFAAGQMAVTNYFVILNDAEPDPNETIRLQLRYPSGGARLAGLTNATIKILDDEVTLQFTSGFYTNKENVAVALVFVERTGALNVPASVTVATTGGGSAQPFTDYTPANVLVTFAAGQARKPAGIRITNDFLVEEFETIGLILEDPSANALLGPTNSATLFINSDDAGGKIQFAAATANVLESRPAHSVVVTRGMGQAGNVTVRLRTAAIYAADGEDYTGIETNLLFGPRETTKTVTIPLFNDTLDESNETFQVTLDDATGGASVGTRSTQTVVILDDDAGGTIGFARGDLTVNEGGTNAVVIVNRIGGRAGAVTVRLATADNTAIGGGVDYGSLNTVLTFAAGETSKTNLIPIIDDLLADAPAPEIINLHLTEFTGGAKPALSNAMIRIVDNESSVSFTNETATATESRTITVTVLRGGALGSTGQVDFMTMDGTAFAGTNYQRTNGTLIFPPNVASKSFTIAILNSMETNAGQTFGVFLKNPQGVLLGAKTNITYTLADAPDPDAVPLAGAEFFRLTAAAVANTTFSRSFNATTDIRASSLGDGVYNVIGITVRGGVPETCTLTIAGLTGPGVFNFDASGPSDAGYLNVLNPTFGYVVNHPGNLGTIIVDGFDGTRLSGRFTIVMSDDTDAARLIRVTGSFRAMVQ